MLRKKEPRLVVTFRTTADAIAMEKLCQGEGVPGRLIPVPRSITANCGMAWSMPVADKPLLEELLNRGTVRMDEIHTLVI